MDRKSTSRLCRAGRLGFQPRCELVDTLLLMCDSGQQVFSHNHILACTCTLLLRKHASNGCCCQQQCMFCDLASSCQSLQSADCAAKTGCLTCVSLCCAQMQGSDRTNTASDSPEHMQPAKQQHEPTVHEMQANMQHHINQLSAGG